MTHIEELATFVARASWERLSEAARLQLRIRLLDSVACALGALQGEPIAMLRAHLEDFGGAPRCSLIGGGRTAPDRAALFNGALVRYLDFNDSYLARHETCHPSDNVAPVLAAAEYAGADGRELLAALAVAYQVQCRLSDEAPVRDRGFDHTTQGSYAVAAGVSRALGLDPARTANAVAIAATSLNALRVSRTGALSHWKGLAYPAMAFGATHAAFLAMNGITGPLHAVEGNKGFVETIAGPFTIDWAKEDLERVTRTVLKRYNAEVHSQSTLEGVLELRERHGLRGDEVEAIEIETFDVAYNIIGGGIEGDKTVVRTKEEADHSLQYMVAVALLDGQVMPEQYAPDRVLRPDVQALLRRVQVRPVEELSRGFPGELPCRVKVKLSDGRTLLAEKRDYEGFLTRPMTWATVVGKLERLGHRAADAALRARIVEAVADVESLSVVELLEPLRHVRRAAS